MSEAHILVVEDETIVAKDIQNRLKNMGYEVPAVTATGEEAIHQVEETHPDLVLMDIMLKGEMDGIAAAEKIREAFNVPVIYLTAYSDENTLSRAKYAEPFGYLLKPFEERELHTTIEMALYKHRMDRKLKENEQWLSTILKSIGDAVIATDKNGRVAFMNPVAEQLTGWNQRDALGRDLMEIFNVIDEKTRTHVESPAERVLQGRSPMRLAYNIQLIARDGTETPIDDSASPIFDAKSQLAGVVVTFHDITERKVAEEVLRQHAQYLIKRVKELQCLYGIFRVVETPGLSLEEVLQKSIATLPPAWQYPEVASVRITLGDGEYRTENFQETPWRLAADILAFGQKVGTVEVDYLAERPAHEEGPFLKEERSLINAIAGQLGHVIERKRAEETLKHDTLELNAMVRELNCARAISGLLDRSDVNLDEAFQKTVETLPSSLTFPGVAGARIRLGSREFRSTGFQETAVRQSSTIMATDREVGALDVFYHQPPPQHDGEFVLKAEQTLIDSVADQLGYAVERKETEINVQGELEDLSRSNAELSRFVTTALHDAQDSLQLASRSLHLATADPAGRRPEELTAFAGEVSHRLSRLIHNLLVYSRVTAGGKDKMETDLEGLLQEVLVDLDHAIRDRQARVTHDTLPTLPVGPAAVAQVFKSLITHALKNHGPEPLKIHVGAANQDGFWEFSVRDNGPAVDPRRLETILDLPERPSGTAVPEVDVDLVVAKKIVERQGGELRAESKSDEGTTFRFTVPTE